LSHKTIRGCTGTEGVVADPEYGTLLEYSKILFILFSNYIDE